MLPSTFIAVILAVWSLFHLLHNFLLNGTICGAFLAQVLQSQNILITLFQVRWFTKRWNRYFMHAGRYWNLLQWFNCGVLFSVVAMVMSVGLLSHTLIRCLQDLPIFAKPQSLHSPQVLAVIVPGVNLPIQDIGYLTFSVLLSGILHELGHAIAACREGVQVNGFGMFLFVIYPGAYVDLNSEDLKQASPIKQLRIYCAGVWHNFVICVLVCALIFSLPFLILPFYGRSGDGVIVSYQVENSPLLGSKGLHRGDTVIKIGHCSVSDIETWIHCINQTANVPQIGSCVPLKNIKAMDTLNGTWNNHHETALDDSQNKKIDCCGKNAPLSHLCYNYGVTQRDSYACLPGRVMMSFNDCGKNEECSKHSGIDAEELCVTPYMVDHISRFTRIVVNRSSSRHHVLYLGDPIDLSRYVIVSEYRPRVWFLPSRLPAMLLKFLQYMFSMSGALALLNIAPCYALDGQWAFKAFVEYFCGSRITTQTKDRLCFIVLTCGTLLIVGNVIFGLLNILTR